MGEEGLKCSIAECKQRLSQIDSMGLPELEKYASNCSSCGNWFLKDNPVAQKTYDKVSLKWAEAFNTSIMKR